MNSIGVHKDRNLINRLFWYIFNGVRLFDLNGDGVIDFNELKYSINLFRENSLEDKVNCKKIAIYQCFSSFAMRTMMDTLMKKILRDFCIKNCPMRRKPER